MVSHIISNYHIKTFINRNNHIGCISLHIYVIYDHRHELIWIKFHIFNLEFYIKCQ